MRAMKYVALIFLVLIFCEGSSPVVDLPSYVQVVPTSAGQLFAINAGGTAGCFSAAGEDAVFVPGGKLWYQDVQLVGAFKKTPWAEWCPMSVSLEGGNLLLEG